MLSGDFRPQEGSEGSVNALKMNPNYTLGDKYKFSLIYNIGILKKVQLEVL
jgi:hypothetical protein